MPNKNAGINGILEKVLQKITPSKSEHREIENIMKKVLNKTEEIIKPLKLSHTIAGSFMRNTYMLDKKEFDVFIMFPESYSREKLEKMGLKIGEKIVKSLKGKYIIAYAEHPYVRAKINGYEVDIVPCYKIKDPSKIKSAVDRTPFHNEWLKKHLSPRLTSEVRLLKQFLKANGIYGSDTKTEGFSGYLCELLIVRYKYFNKLLEAASKWKAGEVFIDLENYYKPQERGKVAKNKFKGQPLIVIDPVDPKRNVASALSPANFVKFVNLCRDFLEKPSMSFFFKKVKIDYKKLEKSLNSRETQFLAVVFKKPNIIPDILYPQLRKTAKRIKNILEEYEFSVLGFDVWTNGNCIILLELEVWKLPNIRKLIGPPIFSKKHSQEFINKYKNHGRIWIENDCYVAEIERKFTQADEKIRHSLSVSLKVLKQKGIASYIAESIHKHGFKLLNNKQIISLAKKNEDFACFLWEYLKRRFF
jgi:tRNA nucleotidyltransferase (CCA-adding enzyme)